jgi:hypothetical protein
MVKMMIDTSKHQEAGAEMSHLFSPHQIDVLDLIELSLRCRQQHALKLGPNFPA